MKLIVSFTLCLFILSGCQNTSPKQSAEASKNTEKVPDDTYSSLHKQFLTPLPLLCDNVERDFSTLHDIFYVWGDNRKELKTRKGCALVNLDGKSPQSKTR